MRKWNWGSQAIPSSVAAPTWSDTIILVQLLFSGAIAQAAGGTAVRDIQIFGMEGLGLEPASRTRSSPCPKGLGLEPASRTRSSPCPNIDVCSLVDFSAPTRTRPGCRAATGHAVPGFRR
jgi:hypothetical protein